tara:strand:+ start:343 stop:672 length:330 start_codon:yes stop_codon:yes gene_type:complete
MKKITFFILLGTLLSCKEQATNKVPAALSEVQMIDALVQVHLLEAAAQLNMLDGIREDSLSLENYYPGLFADKEYSLKDFKESFTAYSKKPQAMEVLLDSVLTRIQMME